MHQERARGCEDVGGSCGARQGSAGASFLTSGLAEVLAEGRTGAGLRTGARKGGSVLSSRLRSRPETLGAAPVLASDFSPSVGPAERVAGMSLGFRIISERELGGTEPLPTTPWYNPPLAPWGGYCLRPSHCRGSYGPIFSRETQMRERASSIWALGSKLCCPISHHSSVT